MRGIFSLACASLVAAIASADEQVDLQKLERRLAMEPAYTAKPLYGLLVFGPTAKTRMWLVLDKSKEDAIRYDVLYADLNGNGNLTERGERFVGVADGADRRFELPNFKDSASGSQHTSFSVRVSMLEPTVMVSMKWRDGVKIGGGYPQDPDLGYWKFGGKAETAPVLWINGDGPFRFQRWYSEKLTIGGTDDFKVFVGQHRNREEVPLIEISRSLAKQLRTIVRKSILAIDKQSTPPELTVRGDRTGLHVTAQNSAGAVEFHQPGNQPNETFHLPITALDDFEAKKDAAVQFTKDGNAVIASWQEGVVPQQRRYEEPEAKLSPPSTPREMTGQSANFVKALQDTCESAAKASDARYGLGCIQLRGSAGDLVGTDCRQLLRQRGFTFPWKDDILIPAMSVFACKEVADAESVAIGKSNDHICLSVGQWKLHIAIDKEARFPKAENVIPNTQGATLLQIDEQDAKFLADNLSSLPGEDQDQSPVTIDANGQVVVRAASGQQIPTELALIRSKTRGKAIRFAVNRFILQRALRLGFTSLYAHSDGRPVLYTQDNRDLVALPLAKEAVVAENAKATRLLSSNETPVVQQPVGNERPQPTTKATSANGQTSQDAETVKHETPAINGQTHGAETKQDGNGLAALIDEAEALKDLLRDCYSRAHTLIASAKRYRKQARVVNSTLASLRELQEVAA